MARRLLGFGMQTCDGIVRLTSAAIAFLFATAVAAAAQDLASGPIKIITPTAPGGSVVGIILQ
jgi:hypothetical protein